MRRRYSIEKAEWTETREKSISKTVEILYLSSMMSFYSKMTLFI